jgi:hypothetical protein
MALKVKYLGWFLFSDAGDPFRKWRFEDDMQALGAVKGDQLFDHGPDYEDAERLNVRSPDHKVKSRHGLAAVEKALGFELPAWRPPREADMKVTEALDSVTAAMREVVQAIDRASTAQKRLDAIKNVVDGTATLSPPPKAPEKSNKYLRLKGEHTYSSGDPFTDWELLVDVPEIPVTRTSDVSPMHAIKGDVIREDYDDELTPFELRRGGRRIGDPEWWQVRHLFVGIKNHEPDGIEIDDGAPSHHEAPTLRRLHCLCPGQRKRYAHVLLATALIPGTPVRAGDFLTFSTGHSQRTDPDVNGAVVLRVPRAQLPTVEEHFDALRVLHVQFNPEYSSAHARLREMRTYLARRPNPRWKDSTSPLVIVRPLVAPVSEPIHATSDDAALFELLCQVGGRMPTGA